MTRMYWIGLLALSALLPTHAEGLSGLWTLRGQLPNGADAAASMAVTPLKTEGRYRGLVVTESGATWRASVWTTSADGRMWIKPYRSSKGVLGALAGAKEPWVATLKPDGDAYQGRYLGGKKQDALRLVRQELPAVSINGQPLGDAPIKVRGGVGKTTLKLTCNPPQLLRLVRLYGVARDDVSQTWGDAGSLTLETEKPGTYRFEPRLGGIAGHPLGRVEFSVVSDVLARVRARVAEVKASGETPIVIFDLDDTLFDTRYRSAALLEDYHKTHGEPRLELVPTETVRYDLKETLANLGFSEHEIDGETFKAIKKVMWPQFFVGKNLMFDKPIAGANQAVASLMKAGATIVYLTGRKGYVPSWVKTDTRIPHFTELSITENGFPGPGPRVQLYLKPASFPGQSNPDKLSTHEFKGLLTKVELPKHGVVVAAFDNEPKNCVAFKANAPAGAIVVHLDTLYDASHGELITDGIEVLPDLLEPQGN